MTLHSVLINANAIICLMLALRLMFFQKTGRYRFFISLTAYLAILSAAWIALTICIAVWRARGNISKITGDR